MKTEVKFFHCKHCGNVVHFLHASGVNVICCGEEMKELIPNTTDGAHEKHVPAAVFDGKKLTVTIGSAPHPMLEEHHIEWITVASGNKIQHAALSHLDSPSAEFCIDSGQVTVYEYCNLHGLWAADFDFS